MAKNDTPVTPEKSLQKPMRDTTWLSEFELDVLNEVMKFGGFFNAHAHIDRAHTLRMKPDALSHIGTTCYAASNLPLSVKQNLVGDLHLGIAYTPENLETRMRYAFERQRALGVTRIHTNIDATPDLPEDGLLAINIALKLKTECAKNGLEVAIGPTPIFGFKDDNRHKLHRWEVFKEAARIGDLISGLGEKDEGVSIFGRSPKYGFETHIYKVIELMHEFHKKGELHLDQMNIPGESGTERLLKILEVVDLPKFPDGEPALWVIHQISPSSYDEDRYARLVDKLLEFNIGVKVCASAGLSMRQLRSVDSKTHTSLARVLELVKAGVPVLLGSDNIADVFVPQGTGDMLAETVWASTALRASLYSLWAKLAAGVRPNDVDRTHVGQVLYEDRKACMKVAPAGWKPTRE